ncbi:hypothetical protein BC835DRAFT_1094287 [Cytidiella melzeri]|nr:hypothetical protein BC835DRAFT_1094287 [Cytidiella melzeri]
MGDTPAIPSEYIPGLLSLGSTYNVLNGKYADSKSTMRQVVDWTKGQARVQEFGGNNYRLPSTVNFVLDTNSDFRSFYGKSTVEYSKSLSAHAGLEANISGFSASVSTDFSESQREDLSHAFTRVSYVVARYNPSLPPTEAMRPLLKPWFIEDLDHMNPLELYKVYGTHLLRSLTVGGRTTFLFSTDIRTYSSETTLLSVSQKEAMDELNESSEMSVVTKGGDPIVSGVIDCTYKLRHAYVGVE